VTTTRDYDFTVTSFIIDGLDESYSKYEILSELGIEQDIINGLTESERHLGIMPLLNLCKKKQTKLGKVLYK